MDANLGPLTTTAGLKPGDVCVVAVKMRNKATGGDYWWKRFVCVLYVGDWEPDYFAGLTLKMRPEENDNRLIDIRKAVVTLLPEDQWPEGVVATRMKAIMTGLIKLGD